MCYRATRTGYAAYCRFDGLLEKQQNDVFTEVEREAISPLMWEAAHNGAWLSYETVAERVRDAVSVAEACLPLDAGHARALSNVLPVRRRACEQLQEVLVSLVRRGLLERK